MKYRLEVISFQVFFDETDDFCLNSVIALDVSWPGIDEYRPVMFATGEQRHHRLDGRRKVIGIAQSDLLLGIVELREGWSLPWLGDYGHWLCGHGDYLLKWWMYKDNEFQRISLIDVFIFAEEVRLSPMKDMALDGAARLRLAVSAFPSGQLPFSPYGKTFRAL